jgi:methylated-DNA-[protein]-cysteine S-methyltransferase
MGPVVLYFIIMASLSDRVYEFVSKVPAGRVTTYGAIGRALGTRAYRAIGQILSRNPNAPEVPCHRVVTSDGSLGGFMGSKSKASMDNKAALLGLEGVEVKEGKVVDFDDRMFE